MKKFISIIILAALIFTFAGCAKTTEIYVDEVKSYNSENHYSNVKLYISDGKLIKVSADTCFGENEVIRIYIQDHTEDSAVGLVDVSTNHSGHVEKGLYTPLDTDGNGKYDMMGKSIKPVLKYGHSYTIIVVNMNVETDSYAWYAGTFTYNGE